MPKSQIQVCGAVPILDKGKKELLSLTGSATIVEIGGKRLLVDLGLFQGGDGSDVFNKRNIDFLKGIDGVIITHSHVDHIGRLPLLYKLGYRGPVYMTPLTQKILAPMLIDSYKVQQQDTIERVRRNASLGARLREALKIKSLLIAKQGGEGIGKEGLYLQRKLGAGYKSRIAEVLQEIDSYCGYYGVAEPTDIADALAHISEPLYDMDDIVGTMSLITSIEYGKEGKIVSSKDVSVEKGTHPNQTIMETLPMMVKNGHNQKYTVATRKHKNALIKSREEKLKQAIQGVADSGIDFTIIRRILKKQIEGWRAICKQYSYLSDSAYKGAEYNKERGGLQSAKDHLRTIGIKQGEDIDTFLVDDARVVALGGIDLPFSYEDIKIASELIVVEKIGNPRQVLGVTLTDAAHLPGSASIQLTAAYVRKKVKEVIDMPEDSLSVCFSGDLGRSKENRLGSPEIPLSPFDYLQIESTYGGKEHRKREDSVNDLLDSITDSKGNVLISVFSQQRLQEILLTLLEAKQKGWDKDDDFEIVVDAPLGGKLTALYTTYMGEVYDLLKEETQGKIFGRTLFRFLEKDEFNDIYITKEGEVVEGEDTKEEEKKKKKYIILASSGMMVGGAIMNHLPHILQDYDATLLAPGYLSAGTIGRQIVIDKCDAVTIEGESILVQCHRKFIDGFSSHIAHSEILEYITACIDGGKVKRGATIALTHGNIEGQTQLKTDLEEILEDKGRTDVKITIPSLFSYYDINSGTFTNQEGIAETQQKRAVKERRQATVSMYPMEKPKVPKFLFSTHKKVKAEGAEVKDLSEGKSEISPESQAGIGDLHQKRDEIEAVYESILTERLVKRLPQLGVSKIDKYLDLIYGGGENSLGMWQLDSFVADMRKMPTKNRQLHNSILAGRKKLRNIDSLFLQLTDFCEKEIPEIEADNQQLEQKIEEFGAEFAEKNPQYTKLSKQKVVTDEEKLQRDSLRKEVARLARKMKSAKAGLKGNQDFIKSTLVAMKKQLLNMVTPEEERELKKVVGDYISHPFSGTREALFHELELLKTRIQNEISRDKQALGTFPIVMIQRRKPHSHDMSIYDNILAVSDDTLVDRVSYDKNMFLPEEAEILRHILQVPLDTPKAQKKQVGNLRSTLKTWQREDQDPGIDASIEVASIHSQCMTILSKLFEKEYFERYVQEHFDIYAFITSGKTWGKYIKETFNLSMLVGNEYDLRLRELEDARAWIDKLLLSIDRGVTPDSIAMVEIGINETQAQVVGILAQYKPKQQHS